MHQCALSAMGPHPVHRARPGQGRHRPALVRPRQQHPDGTPPAERENLTTSHVTAASARLASHAPQPCRPPRLTERPSVPKLPALAQSSGYTTPPLLTRETTVSQYTPPINLRYFSPTSPLPGPPGWGRPR